MNAHQLVNAIACPMLSAFCVCNIAALASATGQDPGAQGDPAVNIQWDPQADLNNTSAEAPSKHKEPQGPQIDPHVDPDGQPLGEWVFIDSSGTHEYSVEVEGWTIFSLETNGHTPMNALIYEPGGRLLGLLDTEGCGIFLNMGKPKRVVVIVENYFRHDNEYRLNVYGSE